MSLDMDNIIELTDEDGNQVSFEHIDTILHEEKEYVLLLPVEPIEGMSEDEEGVVILRIERGEGEEDNYVGIEDDKLLDTVFALYMEKLDDEEN